MFKEPCRRFFSSLVLPRSRFAGRAFCAASCGRIELIVGPMFSGKTTELLRRVTRQQLGGRRTLLVKYSHDGRYSETRVSTHDMKMHDAVACSSLNDLQPSLLEEHGVIGVDEGQFFGDLVEFADAMACRGKLVFVAALDGTFERRCFGAVCELFPRAESITKLAAVCTSCGADASFTRRISGETEVEVIGGTDKYTPLCRSCFFAYPR